jgi:hypothetical protein
MPEGNKPVGCHIAAGIVIAGLEFLFSFRIHYPPWPIWVNVALVGRFPRMWRRSKVEGSR